MVYVCAYAAHDADRTAATDAYEKAEDNKRSEVWRDRRSNRENCEDGEGYHHHELAAVGLR